MASQGESKIPAPGSTKEKRRSLLPSPKPVTKPTGKFFAEGTIRNGASDNGTTEPMELGEVSVTGPFKPGDHVCIAGIKTGILRYQGRTSFAEGEWCGVELDEREGRHDGLVEGVRYFTCKQGHGIFAPSYKVKHKSLPAGGDATVEKPSKLSQPKASGLTKLQKSKIASRTKSPEPGPSGDQVCKVQAEAVAGGSRSAPHSPRFTSKLVKPRGASKSSIPSQNTESKVHKEGSGGFLSREASPVPDLSAPLVGKPPLPGKSQQQSEKPQAQKSKQQSEKPQAQRPSRLPKQSSGLLAKRSSSCGSEQTAGGGAAKEPKLAHSAIPKPGDKKDVRKAEPGLSDTYTISDFREAKLEEHNKKSTSRSERERKARSLSYDLTASPESFNLPIDGKDKKGSLRSSSSSLCSRSSTGSLSSSIPDLLTPSVLYGRRTPVEFGGEAMSEPEDEADLLAAATISHASSLGILPDSVLANNNLITNNQTTVPCTDTQVKPSAETESKDTTELMEKDLDNEISGISTPDMSSSTLSGKDLCSSPERELDLTFDGGAPAAASTSPEKDKDSMAGEMLATPETSSESSPDTDKRNTLGDKSSSSTDDASLTFLADEMNCESDVTTIPEKVPSTPEKHQEGRLSKRSSRCFLEETEQYPKGMRTSLDLDDLDMTQMSASAEIAKTAVQQYAELMVAAEQDRIAMGKTREAGAARRAARIESERVRSVDSEDEVMVMQVEPEAPVGVADTERSQLMSDLQAGHARCDRPVSMISTGSADTGIVADLPTTPRNKERPLSLVSTSSVDTGYQPDTDSEIGTLTTNSPLDDDSPPRSRHQRPPPDQLSPRSEALTLDAAYTETFTRFQKAVMTGTVRANQPVSDSDIYSDTGTLVGESDSDHGQTDIDDMLEQQTLLEAGLEKLLKASGDQPGPIAPGSEQSAFTETLSPTDSTGDSSSSTSTEEDSITFYQGPLIHSPEGPTPMETIPEQVTPEEAAERELASAILAATQPSPSEPQQPQADTMDSLQRSCVQGLPPPAEPDQVSSADTSSLGSQPSPLADSQHVEEINQNQPAAATILQPDLIQLPGAEQAQVGTETKEAGEPAAVTQLLWSAGTEAPQLTNIPTPCAGLGPLVDNESPRESQGTTVQEPAATSPKDMEESQQELIQSGKDVHLEHLVKPAGIAPVVGEESKSSTAEEQIQSPDKQTVCPVLHSESTDEIDTKESEVSTITELSKVREQEAPVETVRLVAEEVATGEEEEPVESAHTEVAASDHEANIEEVVEELIQPISNQSVNRSPLQFTDDVVAENLVDNIAVGDVSFKKEDMEKEDSGLSAQDDELLSTSSPDRSLEEAVEALIIPVKATTADSAIIQVQESPEESPDTADTYAKGTLDVVTEKDTEKDINTAELEALDEKESDELADGVTKETEPCQTLETERKGMQDVEDVQPHEVINVDDQELTGTVESITERDVLVETLEVTDGPIARTSTPVCDSAAPSDSPAGWALTDQTEPNSGPNTTSEVTSIDTDSANSTLTEGDALPIVEIDIIPSEMSESTMKDSGPGEKGLLSKSQKDTGKSESTSGDKKKKKNGVLKSTKSKKIEEVAKTDQKKTTRSIKGAPKDVKSKLTVPSKSNVKDKDNDKSPVKSKIGKANVTKTPVKKPEIEKKTNTRVGSKIADYIKQPTVKIKEDNTVVNNVKTVKNNSNLKKADMTAVGDKKQVHVLPLQRRNPPRSKWGNIMNQIEASKDNKTISKSKSELKVNSKSSTNINNASNTSKTLSARSGREPLPSPRLSRTTPTVSPRTIQPTSRRTSNTGAADSTRSKVTLPRVTTRPALRSTQSPEPARPDSRVSNTSDTSGLNTSRNSSVGGTRSRQSSVSKPENRQAATLRRDRSSSIGSEASTTSQLSSQGSRTARQSTKDTTATSAGSIPKPKVNMAKRRSLVEPSTSRTAASTEPRRSSLATSRLTSKKDSSPGRNSEKKPSNQNRNKTAKSTASLKRSNQPDVVTNSVAPPDAAEEISRLEALCEARTKQLNVGRIQLRTGAMGFEAMAALVKYLTQELDAFSCPEVTAQLKTVREQLSDSQAKLGELTENKASLEKELSDLREQNKADLQKLRDDHQKELQELEQRLGSEKQQEVERVVEKYSQEVSALKTFLEKNINEMKTQHDQSLKDREKQHGDDLKRVKQDQEQQVADLQKQHERRMEEITMTFEHIKFTLSDKVETLRGECEEMRVRERTLQERSQRDAEIKVHMALAQYKHLPAEIDSLKAVMEMRNQELHELRRKKLDLEKQLEELPHAREKIIALQQKVENLEAIIDIKADYERQLAEKHHVLLRKFDRESKANKRLSMDNEELAWRLSNADSPDILRRSVSHSPTHSAEVTPEVVRRRKSPSCTVPSSPRSTEFDKSPVMHSPPKTNLRRSGTYDLLNKDLDEREMRQSDV